MIYPSKNYIKNKDRGAPISVHGPGVMSMRSSEVVKAKEWQPTFEKLRSFYKNNKTRGGTSGI